MQKMKMTLMAAALTTIAAPAMAKNDTVRLVVSSYKNAEYGYTTPASVSDNVCVMSLGGEAKWCVSGAVAKKTGLTTQASTSKRVLKTEVVELESHGYDAKDIARSLRETGRFDEVVVDVPVRHAYTFTETEPTKSYQDRYFGSSSDFASGSNVYGAAAMIGEPSGGKLDVLILDSSFYDTDDVVYHPGSGRSFVTATDEIPNDDYRPRSAEGCDGHGVAVAGIIGGTINNGAGGDGVTNAVNLHPVRVMNCGSGYLSDISRALKWANGDSENLFYGDTSDASPYEGNVGVINISITGYTGSEESGDEAPAGCPIYMQEAIDELKASGWNVVVSAGNNYGEQTRDYSPANCDGVISVAALESSGDKANFSNQGEVSVAAHGTSLVSSCDENSDAYCLFSGTSAASPFVAGIMAMVKQHTNIEAETLDILTKATASKANFGPECQGKGCGNGLVNAKALLEAAVKNDAGELNTISFALNEGDDCDAAWFMDHFGGVARLCEMYSVKFVGGFDQDDAVYRLISAPEGVDMSDSANQTLLGEFEKGHVMLQDLQIEGNKFGMQICSDGQCGEVFEMNISGAESENQPVACQ